MPCGDTHKHRHHAQHQGLCKSGVVAARAQHARVILNLKCLHLHFLLHEQTYKPPCCCCCCCTLTVSLMMVCAVFWPTPKMYCNETSMRLLLGISTLLTRKLCTRRAVRLGAADYRRGKMVVLWCKTIVGSWLQLSSYYCAV